MWGQDVEKVKPYVKDGGYELDMRLQPIDNYISSHVITVEVSTVEGAPRALRKFCHGSKAEFQKVMQGGQAKFRLTPENLERWDVLGYDSASAVKARVSQQTKELPKASFDEINIYD